MQHLQHGTYVTFEALTTLSNLIQKQQKEIEKKDKIIKRQKYDKAKALRKRNNYKSLVRLKNRQLEKKDKMINEMIKVMSRNMPCDFIRTTDKECANTDCESCFKQYFEKKVQ